MHKTVSAVADIMFVNRMKLIVIIFRHVKFTTVKYLGKRTTGNIYKSLEKINDVYYIFEMHVYIFTWIGIFQIS